MSPHSILAHLAPLLTNQVENVATDALAHLLLEYPALSDAFRAYLSKQGFALPEQLIIKTQASWLDGAIPDLVGIDLEGRYSLIVESKFWARLTPNQPETYIKRLPPDIPAILLFIAPASRLRYLWNELIERSNIAQTDILLRDSINQQYVMVQIEKQHILALTSWESLLDTLYHSAVEAEDKYAQADIWQLQSLCARIDEDAFKPINENEIKSPSQMRINQFKNIVDKLVIRLVESGIASTTGYRATPGPGYYKRYMSLNGLPASDWCVEFNIEYSQENVSTNLWLTASITPHISGVLSRKAPVYYRRQKQILFPLFIPLGVEEEAAIQGLIKQIYEVTTILKSSI